MKLTKYLFITLSIAILVIACKSDDGDGGGGEAENCTEVDSETAQGNFREAAFVSPGGTYIAAPGAGNGFNCSIYVKNPTNTDCVLPTFDGTQDVILFSINELVPQSLVLSELGGLNTLNFNRIDNGTTSIELATCGVLEITSYDSASGELQGTVIAIGQQNSKINGSFTLSLCEF